jgi:hypothetical protein
MHFNIQLSTLSYGYIHGCAFMEYFLILLGLGCINSPYNYLGPYLLTTCILYRLYDVSGDVSSLFIKFLESCVYYIYFLPWMLNDYIILRIRIMTINLKHVYIWKAVASSLNLTSSNRLCRT